mgnify:FL=1
MGWQGWGHLKTVSGFAESPARLVGTTFRLRLKRIQPNPPALVGIGTANRSAGSTREADVSTNTRFRLTDSKARGQSPRYGVRLSQMCFDE